ncbi:MAG: molecular chaperone GrpE [Microgenomates group bacterium Gr01-1014_7]|nr:MAG: molecular chaperone GrpE [Microgenomates group bacterium Gr01-1014_7]
MGKKQENKVEELEKKVSDLEKKVIDYDNQLKRAVADYQNLEKRISEGRSELTNFVGGELIKRMLPVLDHLEQALTGVSEQERQSGWAKGVELAVKEFTQVLQSEGLEEIVVSGEFNPALQEAVDTREGDDNIILEVVRKGYTLNGRVLRPTQVVVGRKQPEKETQEQMEKTVDTGDYA